jgi:hypothetical protein
MPDYKEDQNDASDRDDHFLSNGRTIKSGENIHDRFWHTARRAAVSEVINAARSVNPAGVNKRSKL